MAFYTNKHINRHNKAKFFINEENKGEMNGQLLKDEMSVGNLYSNQKNKLNRQQIIVLQMLDEPGFIKVVNKIGENMYDVRKQALMEMTKYRYKKMIELQNKRLIERQQFQNELQKSKNQWRNKAIVQANRIKAETRDTGRSVRNWMKKNCQQGNILRHQKWMNEAIKIERDTSQLEKKKIRCSKQTQIYAHLSPQKNHLIQQNSMLSTFKTLQNFIYQKNVKKPILKQSKQQLQ